MHFLAIVLVSGFLMQAKAAGAANGEEPRNATTKVAVVGAGLAGLRAAWHLNDNGVDFTVFEASDRVGGRVFPFKYKDGFLQHGAEYVNGNTSEVYEIARKKSLISNSVELPDQYVTDQNTQIFINGKLIDGETKEKWNSFASTLEDEVLYKEAQDEKMASKSVAERVDFHFKKWKKANLKKHESHAVWKRLLEIYKNYYQTEWSAPVGKLAVANLDTWDDGGDGVGSWVLNKFGYKAILDEFTSNVPKEKIRLGAAVQNINFSDDKKVRVALESGERFEFDHVIVTCPLGYLKRHMHTLFSPTFALSKAVADMGFGSNMKIFLEYDKPWWSNKTTSILVSHDPAKHSLFAKLTKNLMVFQPNPVFDNVLVAWVADWGPSEASHMSDDELLTVINEYLRQNLNGTDVVDAKKVYRHNWLTDPFVLGSYSYLTSVAYNRHDDVIVELGTPIFKAKRPAVCFAGEHTDPEMYQTAVGAARSGKREAERIIKFHQLNSE